MLRGGGGGAGARAQRETNTEMGDSNGRRGVGLLIRGVVGEAGGGRISARTLPGGGRASE